MMKVRYDIEINEFYSIPAGSEVEFCGYENGFAVIKINSMQYYVNEGYLEEIKVLA